MTGNDTSNQPSAAVLLAASHVEENAEGLVREWIAWLRSRVPTATVVGLPERALRNHIPPVLRSLAAYLRSPVELSREELLGNLRLHGQIRRDQGYTLQEVLAEFDGLAELVTASVNQVLVDRAATESVGDVMQVTTRLASGLRTVSFVATGTFIHSDDERRQAISSHLEEFARAVSHELRNPLNTIMLGLQVLRDESIDRESLLRQIEVLETSVSRSAYLLDTIRVLAVAEGARTMKQLTSLSVAVKAAIRELGESAVEADVSVRVEGELPDVRVETILAYIVLVNLLGNSIKYGDPDKDASWVRLSSRVIEEEDDSGFCEIEVVDNGIGIPAEHVARVMQKGYRAHPTRAQGTGMGLYMVQQSVIQRGGTITIESDEGSGTTVVVRIRCLHADTVSVSPDALRVENLVADSIQATLGDSGPDGKG